MNKNSLKSLIIKSNLIVNCRRSNSYQLFPEDSHSETSYSSHTSSVKVLPLESRVVIYGNDLTTLSIAYHLSEDTNFGNNCVVITGNKIDGKDNPKTSSQQFINSCPLSHINVFNPRVAQLIHYSKQLLSVNTCGSLYLARNQSTVDSFRRRISSSKLIFNSKTTQRPIEYLSAEDISKRYPNIFAVDDIRGGVFVPNDGLIEDISEQKNRLQELSEKNGIKFFDNLLLNKININNNLISNVELFDCNTNTIKRIECKHFINSSNNYLTRLIAKRSVTRVRVPTLCVHNQVLCTKPFTQFKSVISSGGCLPVVHDFDKQITVYQTSDERLCLSGYEKVSKILQKNFPQTDKTGAMNEEMPKISENWDDFHRILDPILSIIPSLSSAKLERLVARLENFTPDGRSLVGEVPEIRNYWLAASVLPQLAAGAGLMIADAITKRKPTFGHDFWSLDPRRFISLQSNRIFLFDRLREVPAKTRYNINYPQPYNDYQTGHGFRLSPLYHRFKEAGALFTQIMGYDRPAVYMPSDAIESGADGSASDSSNTNVPVHKFLETQSFGRPYWLNAVKEEYQACREGVAILDYNSFSKFQLRSPHDEALELLQYLCSNDVNINVGSIVNTGMQNERGGYENDVSVIRLANNQFMIVGPSEQQTRCMSWLKSHNIDSSVQITDISSQYTAICLMGPLSKQVLSEVLSDPSELDTFPFFTFKELSIGLAKNVRICNQTHTGELGWVLYIPNQYALHVYDLLLRIGQRYDMKHVGSIAMRSLRIEKFFAFWGQDLDATTTPLECGRSFRVKFDKDFLGKSALLTQKEEGVRRRYVQLLLEDFDSEQEPIWPWGGEPIYMSDSGTEVPVGLTTTTGFGFTLQKHVCLGFIRHPEGQVLSNDFLLKSQFEVDVGGKRFKARTNIHSPKLAEVAGRYLATR